MEKKNKKLLILSVIVCLLLMTLGIVLYNKLPEQMPIHFTINNVPDNYTSKNSTLFGIPIIMAIFQAVCLLSLFILYNNSFSFSLNALKISTLFILAVSRKYINQSSNFSPTLVCIFCYI